MGEVLVSMPVGEPTVRVALGLRIKGKTYAANYDFADVPREFGDDGIRRIAQDMIRLARREAGA